MKQIIEMYELAHKLAVKETNRYINSLRGKKYKQLDADELLNKITGHLNKRIQYHIDNMLRLQKLQKKVLSP